jgi:cell division protein FtsB
MRELERMAESLAEHSTVLRVAAWMYRARRKLATGGMSLAILALGYHVICGANGMLVYQQKRADHQRLQQDVLRLQQENARTAERIRGLKSDPKVIEREAREQLKYARPGETVYIAPEPRERSSATARNR